MTNPTPSAQSDSSSTKSEVADAKRSHVFTISAKHVQEAVCGDPAKCVIAQALTDSMGAFFDGVEVGSTITKVYYPGRVIRFATPASLRKALITFDKTGNWELPEGSYELHPPSPSARLGARPSRWKVEHLTKSKPGRDVFGGRALPTRRVKRANP